MQTTNTQTTKPRFTRRRALGFQVLNLEIGVTRYLKFTEFGTFEKKDGDTLEYATVIDLETGEEYRLWLDGQLKFRTKDMKLPFDVEVTRLEKKEAEIMVEGKLKTTEVNDYKIYEIDTEN